MRTTLNPYKIHWAITVNNSGVLIASEHAPTKEKAIARASRIMNTKTYIITDKQYGMMVISWNEKEPIYNGPLIHKLMLKQKHGGKILIPMTKEQFENPIVR